MGIQVERHLENVTLAPPTAGAFHDNLACLDGWMGHGIRVMLPN
jgi:hypothetical protein